MSEEKTENILECKAAKHSYSKEFKIKSGLFLAGVSGISALIGFGATVASAKKHDPVHFDKGMVPAKELQESGAHLALRALGWGTLYAMEEFRNKMGSVLPKIPKNDPPIGRTEFSGLNDLLDYLQHHKPVKDK
ncbi:hypothetical protein NQ317_019662 [Molorchus minor]|uniref:Transmembrane protein 242 n=1 Tax=Molorchus minor TaxID=1323400 RepID=A0ABQ9JJQ1_9CUCU|nr:hypothetical protein NQ317_019662 [Molorchus minor]